MSRSSILASSSYHTRARIHRSLLSCRDLAANAYRRPSVHLARGGMDTPLLCCTSNSERMCRLPSQTLHTDNMLTRYDACTSSTLSTLHTINSWPNEARAHSLSVDLLMSETVHQLSCKTSLCPYKKLEMDLKL